MPNGIFIADVLLFEACVGYLKPQGQGTSPPLGLAEALIGINT